MTHAFRRATSILAAATVALAVGPFGGIAQARDPIPAVPTLPLPSLPLPSSPNAADTDPPETSILVAPSNPSNDTTPSFTMGTDEPGSFECSLDGDPFAPCANPHEVTPALADGAHSFAARAVDLSANVDPSPATLSWTVDTVVPQTTITAGPSNPTTETSPEFAFSSNETPVEFECRLLPNDSNWIQGCVSPFVVGPLAEGTYTFEVRAIDPATNVDATPAAHVFRVDTSGPVTTIDSAPSDPSNEASPSFTFSTTDASSPIVFECRVDGGATSACSSPEAVGPLSDGSHTFEVRGTDALGNVGSFASHTWTVDLTGPETQIDSGPAAQSNQTSATFTFSSPEGGATFECALDGAAFSACVSPKSYTSLTAGGHLFTVRAKDALGNPDASPATHAWTIDLTAPNTTITSGPSGPTNNASPTFEFTSTEPGSTFQCRRHTGQPWVSCSSPYTLTPYADGPKVFSVRAIDAAGNIDASAATRSFTVDTVLPTASFTSTPSSPTNAEPVAHSFTSSDPGSGIAAIGCAYDAETFQACTSPYSRAGLADGVRTLFVQVTDNAGNVRTIQHTFTVDRTAPSATITSGPGSLTASTDATFTFTGSDATSGVASFTCSVDGGSFAPCTSPATFGPLADGDHTLAVRAIDNAGNVSSSATWSWTVDAAPPVVTFLEQPQDPTNVDQATFRFEADETPVTFACSLDGAAFTACDSPAVLTGLSDGSHVFSVRATDDAGNEGPATDDTWLVDLTAPTAAITGGPADPSNDATPEFTFTGADAGSGVASFECSLAGGTFEPCSSPHGAAITGDDEQTYSFSVRAIDSAGNTGDAAEVSWFYDVTAPTVTSLTGPPSPTSDNTPAFTFTGADGAGAGVASFECQVNAGPTEACASPETADAVTDGEHTFRVRALDLAGNTGEWSPIVFVVDTGAPQTTIDGGPADPDGSSSPIFAFSSDETGSTFQCSVDGALAVACASGDTFGPLVDGPHTFAVHAIDAAGNADLSPATFAWSVDTTAPTVNITSRPNNPTNATSATFSFSISDASATTATCVLDGTATDPACMSPALYSGPLSNGTHTFSLTVTDAAGNTTSLLETWVVDTVRPVLGPLSGPPAYTNVTSASITFSATDDRSGVASYRCRLIPAAFAPCSSPFELTDLTDRGYEVRVTAVDHAGNVSSQRIIRWRVDTLDPITELTEKPKHFCCEPGTTATFAWTVDGTGSPVARSSCSIDGGEFAACTSPLELADVAEGVHAFRIYSTDAAGNVEAELEYSWTQGVPPGTTITSSPPATSSSTSATFTFTSDRSPVTFRCLLQQIDGPQAYFQSCSSPVAYSGLADGSYHFEVRTFDSLGNPDPTPATWDFTVDATGPVTTLAQPPSPTASSSVTMTFSADDPAATFECQIDGGSFAACTSPHTVTGVAEGSHTFSGRATDPLGNVGSVTSRTVVVDTTGPTTTITSAPAATTTSTTATFTFAASDGSGTGVAGSECAVDTGAFVACSSPFTVEELSDGAHTFAVRSTDAVGNGGPTASASWTVDTTGPSVTITSPTPGLYAANARVSDGDEVQSAGDIDVTAAISEVESSSIAFTANGEVVSHSCSAGTCTARIMSPSPGAEATVVVTAVDAHGNSSSASVVIQFLA